jgi:DUF4097 and DUF4098 domain-containing protein YvlB
MGEQSGLLIRNRTIEGLMKKTLLLSSLAVATFVLAGCEGFDPTDWGNSDRYKEEFSSTHKLASGGRVVLEGFNGSVEVVGWDREEVEVAGTKQAAREEVMQAIKVDVTADAGMVRIRARKPQEMNCNCGVKFQLKVPKKVVLEDIGTSNGSLRLESVNGSARMHTSNGSVHVWGVTGDIDMATSNGSIDVDKFAGAAELKTSNGRVKASGVEGAFSARTSNGSIDVDIEALDKGRPLVLSSSNGSINVSLRKWQNNEVRASTSNSSVNVRLPEGVAAEVKAATSNGHITTDFEVATTQKSKTRMNGRIGGGGALLDLSTTNGNIRLMKR